MAKGNGDKIELRFIENLASLEGKEDLKLTVKFLKDMFFT